jgi:hypothetical protein
MSMSRQQGTGVFFIPLTRSACTTQAYKVLLAMPSFVDSEPTYSSMFREILLRRSRLFWYAYTTPFPPPVTITVRHVSFREQIFLLCIGNLVVGLRVRFSNKMYGACSYGCRQGGMPFLLSLEGFPLFRLSVIRDSTVGFLR